MLQRGRRGLAALRREFVADQTPKARVIEFGDGKSSRAGVLTSYVRLSAEL
jgi:hypothetical protein